MGGGIIRSDFYEIVPREDGLVDVYLIPSGAVYMTEDGLLEYDVELRVVRGVEPFAGLEEDVRARCGDWCESGETI